MEKTYHISSIDELQSLANTLLDVCKSARKFAFYGEIGAGKTTFIKLICQALGVKNLVSSPTFSIINEYETAVAPIYHIDLYRLKTEEEAFNIHLFEYLDSPNYCFIEWPEIIEHYLPEDTVKIKVNTIDEFSRTFLIQAIDHDQTPDSNS